LRKATGEGLGDVLAALFGWDGGEGGEGDIFPREVFDRKLVGLEQLDQWSRPNVQSPSLPFFGKYLLFWQHPIKPSAHDHWLLVSPSWNKMHLPTWLAILAALASGLDAKALYHRIYHPTLAPAAKFSLRGTLHDGAVVDASGLESDLATFSQFISQLDSVEKLNGALYQLAFERDYDLSPEDWILSSVKAVSTSFPGSSAANNLLSRRIRQCHLHAASSDSIFLHLAGNGEPSAINYFLSPLPFDGVCPFPTQVEARVIKPVAFANTTVYVQKPRLPPL